MAPATKKQRLSNGNAADIHTEAEIDELVARSVAQDAPAPKSDDKEKAAQQKRSLFVRSLPATTTTESLTELFSDSYPVKHATAVIDPETKQCKGYGFVTFADAEDATRAKQEFNGHVLEGRKLRVEIAEPRKRDGESGEQSKKLARETELPPKLIVRNLPWSIKRPEHLSKLFQSYGKVKHAYIPTKAPGLMAGFGFVVMRGKKNAKKAIEGVNGKEIDGRTIAVDWAVEKNVYQGATNETEDKVDDEEGEDDLEAGPTIDAAGGEDDGDLDELDDDIADESDEDDDDDDDPSDEEDDIEIDLGDGAGHHGSEDRGSTLFVRNLPFTCDDEALEDHFSQFGSVRYARVVMDHVTERSKGTGFVCFYNKDEADACLRNAPRQVLFQNGKNNENSAKNTANPRSILQNEATDPSGQYTMLGRVLQVTGAVDKNEASRLTQQGVAHRHERDKDKRRLYLLSEGTISSRSPLWDSLSPSEKAMREASAKQRKTLIESNPSLHLSLTRLSIRNIPRSVTSKELKALARDAIVGFASDVKAGKREKLSREELSRNAEEMQAAETARKRAGKGLVKQAKIVFEGASGSKVSEDSGAGRSRGYGFIEYYTHRSALMGLRWLNGHAIGYQPKNEKTKVRHEDIQDRKKRLIVEFAIENAQVVLRRNEREYKAKDHSTDPKRTQGKGRENQATDKAPDSRKRKRRSDGEVPAGQQETMNANETTSKSKIDEKIARRNQIIGRKRALRRNRQGKA